MLHRRVECSRAPFGGWMVEPPADASPLTTDPPDAAHLHTVKILYHYS